MRFYNESKLRTWPKSDPDIEIACRAEKNSMRSSMLSILQSASRARHSEDGGMMFDLVLCGRIKLTHVLETRASQ